MTSRETLLAWLKDAYAMESGMETVLDAQARDADRSEPEAAERIRQHIYETRRHAEMIRECIERNGGTLSTMKNLVGKVTSFFQVMTSALAADEVVKNCLSSYGAEHFEIACYKALIAAADSLGDVKTVEVCRQILEEEERMAEYLGQNIPKVVNDYLGMKTA